MERSLLAALLVVCALAPARADKEFTDKLCPPGQKATPSTQGHCCWIGQGFSTGTESCFGGPTACPAGMEASGETCIRSMGQTERIGVNKNQGKCGPGERISDRTAGHCCWPGQSWSTSKFICVGVPSECPRGREVEGEQCVFEKPAAPPPPVEVKRAPGKAPSDEMFTGVTAEANLPDQLTRADIVGTMSGLKPKVHDCFAQWKAPGVVTVVLVVTGDGKIESSSIGGGLAGTPTAECVLKAARGAQFKRFKGRAMPISYPMLLN
ncbi:MAG: hypothetical protein EXR72_26315 [Myxococcales bacterium]|nr:hypothetical protein [Myxococcales bacterium]